jgi:transglutaminase-like putative cysteine protease
MQLAAAFSAIRNPLRAPSAEAQRLYWSMGAVGVALLPHLLHVPAWIPLLVCATAAWRIAIELRAWRLPPKWLRILIALAAMLAVVSSYRTLNGLDAGSALLITMLGVKFLETRGVRDCTMLILIGFVLLFAALLYNQGLLRLPYILGAAWLLTAALLRIHQSARPSTTRAALRITAVMVLQALPITIALFLFFPRLPGQFWALPARGAAATGLSDEMTPGDISELSVSGATAFRVAFDGPLPPPSDRYWRGPVLHDFDGRSWRRDPGRILTYQRVNATGPGYSYRITLEPTQRNWLLALDVPTTWPSEGIVRSYDFQLLTRRPIATLSSFALTSHTQYSTSLTLPLTIRRADTALPGAANPRTRALATQLRASVASDAEYIQAILAKFRNEEYYYTLTPPLLGEHASDDFLFDTKRGFCEHFASAFASLMRAANIPARVVTGYQGGEYNALGDYLVVRQSDAHAWTEVWLDDQGWVRVDPTAAVAPNRIEQNLDAALGDEESVPGRFLRRVPLFANAQMMWDAVNNFWNNRIVEYDELKQRSLMEWLGVDNTDWRDLGIAFGIALATFFAALTAYLAWQFRPRKRDPARAAYDALCRKLERIATPKSPHEGPSDYLHRVAAERPALANELGELRSVYVDLRYGPMPLASQMSRFKYLVNRLRV